MAEATKALDAVSGPMKATGGRRPGCLAREAGPTGSALVARTWWR